MDTLVRTRVMMRMRNKIVIRWRTKTMMILSKVARL